jgi:hypothetical protein
MSVLRLFSVAFVAIGLAAIVLSALADPLGIGDEGDFGNKQVLGIVKGAALIAVGLALVYVRRRRDTSVQPGN